MAIPLPNSSRRPVRSDTTWRLVDQFDSTYWSGHDLQIYAEDLQLDDAIQINYNVMEQNRPYYGWNSWVPDRIFSGTRLVVGELSVNFKRHGWLYAHLEYLRNGGDKIPDLSITNEHNNASAGGLAFSGGLSSLTNASPETLRNLANQKNTVAEPPRVGNIQDPRTFSYTPSGDKSLFATQPKGFDLYIVFGAAFEGSKRLGFNSDDNYIPSVSAYEAEGDKTPFGTALKLEGVSFSGIGTIHSDDGRPIVETLSFQARDAVPLKSLTRD